MEDVRNTFNRNARKAIFMRANGQKKHQKQQGYRTWSWDGHQAREVLHLKGDAAVAYFNELFDAKHIKNMEEHGRPDVYIKNKDGKYYLNPEGKDYVKNTK
jgi:hypothetical protein